MRERLETFLARARERERPVPRFVEHHSLVLDGVYAQEGFAAMRFVALPPPDDAAMTALNSGRVRLLDHERLISQLLDLERRTARGGRDSIDHTPRRA